MWLERIMEMDNRPDARFKIVLLGDVGVGKTSLLQRFVDDTFSDTANWISDDFRIKRFEVEKKIIELEIWDTASQDRFRNISGSMYQKMDAAIIVFGLTDMESFRSIQGWIQETERYATDSTLQLVVGNKSDLEDERVISHEEADV